MANSSCFQDQVTIRPGRNIWVLARTDRDGADLAGVLDTAGGVLKRFLGQNSPAGTRSVFEVLQSPKDDPHQARFVIGAARPVLVDAVQADSPEHALATQPQLGEEQTDYFTDCPTFRTIAAQRPWYVTVAFDWRAPKISIPWPRRFVNFLGVPFDVDQGNDWLLIAAGFQGEAKESDTSLLGELSDETRETIVSAAKKAGSIVKPVLIGLSLAAGVGALIYFAGGRRRREDAA